MKRRPRVIVCLLAAMLLLSGSVALADGVTAEKSPNTVYVDGREVQFDSYLIDGRNYVQLREVGEAVGFSVDWDEATRSVLINSSRAKTDEAVIVSNAQTLRVTSLIIDGKEYVALEDLAKLDGMEYDANAGRMTFTSPEQTELLARIARLRQIITILGAALGVMLIAFLVLLFRRSRHDTDVVETTYTINTATQPEKEPEKVVETQTASVPRSDDDDAQERATRQIVDEICQSVLPQELKSSVATLSFWISGEVRPGTRRSCSFYDYFMLDDKYLCVVMGQVPGGEIADALFTVVAQTAIRSRLRMGRSLVDTMSDVNAQLYDLGEKGSLCALVGVLNVPDGRFSFVNAGGTVPFLMRSDGSYEYLRTPIYAPLGVNENVNYRFEKLRFNQGDRLFLYTSDLGEMQDKDGGFFREQELQAALNRSRGKARTSKEVLKFVADEAAVFCEREEDVLSYAAISFSYQKGNRDFIYKVVHGEAESAPVVTDFLKKAFEDGGVGQADRARIVVMTDELFALCCRFCAPQTNIKVECAIPAEGTQVGVRMIAAMNGVNPLEATGDPTADSAAEYIKSHADQTDFKSEHGRDTVSIVCMLH